MRSSATVLTSLLALSVASLAGAQPSVDARGFRGSTDPASGLYLEPASSPGTGEWNANLWLSYAYRPITLRDPSTDEIAFDVVSHQVTADLAAGVGIAQRVALGLDLPVLVYQGGDDPTPESTRSLGDTPLPSQGIGDLGLVGKLTLVRPTGGDFGGFALALHERLTLPTGDDASFLAEGAITSETRLLAEYRLVALGIHLAAGAKLRAEEARVACADTPIDPQRGDLCATRFGHELPFGLGFSLRPQAFGLDEQGRVTLYLETHGHLPISPIAPFESAGVVAAQLGVGARYALRDLSLIAGVETALVSAVGSAPLRAIASVSWAPRVHDADADGVEDEADQCRELGEDRDGFQDEDGCPEGDNDEDGVVDEEDRCAAQAEDEDGFQDEDGCPDPDNDGDGVLDAEDPCPDEPGHPAASQRGCPVRDTDADGIEGERDRCPEQAEDKDGFQDDDGCPDPDNDGDAIPDAQDACPAEKGVDSSDPKQKGCPNPDPDRDTILAPADKCPDQAEVWNGLDDADGCPDDDPKKNARPLVVVKEIKAGPVVQIAGPATLPVVELAGPVKLTDAGQVDPASAPLLAALATELLRHPAWTVRVGVRSSPKVSEEAAGRRAAAVLAELQRLTRRKDIGEVAPWREVKDAPRAEMHGIAFKIRLPLSP